LNENLLKPSERIRMTLDPRRTSRLPRGEILVEEAFPDRHYPEEKGASYFEKMKGAKWITSIFKRSRGWKGDPCRTR
jgi:hypothetical protein